MATAAYEFDYQGTVISISLCDPVIYDLLVPGNALAQFQSDR